MPSLPRGTACKVDPVTESRSLWARLAPACNDLGQFGRRPDVQRFVTGSAVSQMGLVLLHRFRLVAFNTSPVHSLTQRNCQLYKLLLGRTAREHVFPMTLQAVFRGRSSFRAIGRVALHARVIRRVRAGQVLSPGHLCHVVLVVEYIGRGIHPAVAAHARGRFVAGKRDMVAAPARSRTAQTFHVVGMGEHGSNGAIISADFELSTCDERIPEAWLMASLVTRAVLHRS